MGSDSLRDSLRHGLGEFRSTLKGNVGVMALSRFLFSLSGALVQPFLLFTPRVLELTIFQ